MALSNRSALVAGNRSRRFWLTIVKGVHDMKIRLLPIIASCAALFSAPAFSQSVPLSVVAETAAPAMWRVADADSEYILIGTFHILPPALNWRSEKLNEAVATADTIYFEVDADAPDAAAKTLNVVMTQGFNPPGKSLSSMLEPADAEKLKAIVKSLRLPFAAVDTMRPWNAFLTMSVQFIINKGFDPGAGVDSVLLKESKVAKKDIRFFESLEEQLAFFTGLSPEVEKELLIVTLRDWDNQEAAFDELFSAWTQGDTAFLDAQMNDMMREQAREVYELLIINRNKAWAEELDAALSNESGKGVVAVGAAHLVGDEFSVPALLAAKGYEVSRYDIDESKDAAEIAPEVDLDADMEAGAETDAAADTMENDANETGTSDVEDISADDADDSTASEDIADDVDAATESDAVANDNAPAADAIDDPIADLLNQAAEE